MNIKKVVNIVKKCTHFEEIRAIEVKILKK